MDRPTNLTDPNVWLASMTNKYRSNPNFWSTLPDSLYRSLCGGSGGGTVDHNNTDNGDTTDSSSSSCCTGTGGRLTGRLRHTSRSISLASSTSTTTSSSSIITNNTTADNGSDVDNLYDGQHSDYMETVGQQDVGDIRCYICTDYLVDPVRCTNSVDSHAEPIEDFYGSYGSDTYHAACYQCVVNQFYEHLVRDRYLPLDLDCWCREKKFYINNLVPINLKWTRALNPVYVVECTNQCGLMGSLIAMSRHVCPNLSANNHHIVGRLFSMSADCDGAGAGAGGQLAELILEKQKQQLEIDRLKNQIDHKQQLIQEQSDEIRQLKLLHIVYALGQLYNNHMDIDDADAGAAAAANDGDSSNDSNNTVKVIDNIWLIDDDDDGDDNTNNDAIINNNNNNTIADNFGDHIFFEFVDHEYRDDMEDNL
ncbi:uncharacterized protein LOC128951506 [Oppia nitens]|uniref:uncharacterized protein LOC128951506 n=1 Tax=Oppia nitens TaxID=1686743 RepID=UPI0023DABFF7|nr:uncharacterized protein LOC128951506 [Oppia nitens]